MEYYVPLIMDSNSDGSLYSLHTANGRQLVVIFSDPAKWSTFSDLASKMIAAQGKKLGCVKMNNSSFEDVVNELTKLDTNLHKVTFLHDNEPECEYILTSMRDYIRNNNIK